METILADEWFNSFFDYVKQNGFSREIYGTSNNTLNGGLWTYSITIRYEFHEFFFDRFYVEIGISLNGFFHQFYPHKYNTSPHNFNQGIDASAKYSSHSIVVMYNYFANIKKQYIENELVKILLLTIHEQIDTKTQSTWRNIELVLLDEYILRHILHY